MDDALRIATVSAALADHASGFFKPEEIAADAVEIVRAVDEAKALRASGKKALGPTKRLQEMADKHAATLKFGPHRSHIFGFTLGFNLFPFP